ncbi:MAG: helix-turn-helix domain-containing protein [Methylococcaceae bacterium]|nr:helix-turn-helix domain-containing protein [Methylococcaceae bacterium]
MTKKNVCHLVVEGKLLGFKAGGSWRFKELDIENWIEEQK